MRRLLKLGFPLQVFLDVPDHFLTHSRSIAGGCGDRIDGLSGESGVGKERLRLARVEKVDRSGGGEAGSMRDGPLWPVR